MKRGGNMNPALRQETDSATEPQQTDCRMQKLHQYLDLLQTSLDRYGYLKKSGAPDIVLYMEKGLIDRQMLFLSKAFAQPTK
jgi:hypothetical protein